MPVLTDTRTLSLADAPGILEEIAIRQCRVERAKAKFEEQIARRKQAYTAEVADDNGEIVLLASRLRMIVDAHPDAFRRPRAIATTFGRYGRRKVSDVKILSLDALVACALEDGHPDLVKTLHKPDKVAIGKRLRAGQAVPGAALEEGERSFYEVDKALLKEAKSQA
mgnify:CR=1 FL=1